MIMPVRGQRLEVLVADDDPIARDILQIYLESIGCRVQVVTNGDDALRACEEGADRIELVILDARMPGPSPSELYELVRRISPSVPILYCSGVSPDDPDMQFINEHGLKLVPKPFGRADLLQALRRLLSAAESASAIRVNYAPPRREHSPANDDNSKTIVKD